MDNTVIKNLIYNQLFAAANYDLIATIAPDDPTKTRILNFSADCKNNANMLDRIYQEENTSSYHPIVQKPQFHGSFIESIHWMLNYEGDSFRLFHINSFYDVYTTAQRQLLTYIAGILNDRAIGLTHISLTK